MRVAALGIRLLTTAAFGFAISSLDVSMASAADDAGHAIAEKFATEAAKQTKAAADKRAADARKKAEALKRKEAEKRRAADATSEEADMLAAARIEAEQRRLEQERLRAAAEAAEAERLIAEAKAEQQRLTEMRAAEERRSYDLKAADAKAANEARKVAEAQRLSDEKRLADERLAADAKASDEARKVAEAQRLADEKRLADERRAADAKAADEARKVAEAQRLSDEKRLADERRAADAKAADEARRIAEDVARNADEAREAARQQAMAAEREEEARRVAGSLRQAREARSAGSVEVSDTDLSRPGAMRIEPPETAREQQAFAEPVHSGQSPGRVTVLLLMEPGNRGIRRHNKTADPVLCSTGGCYISNGADQSASLMPGRKALGLGRIFGARAGACRNSLGCVFRGVEIGSLPGVLQPVDMRVIHHDRRESQSVEAPAECRVITGRLACRRTIQASNYVMWVIPEAVAEAAGPQALERALADGLPDAEHAALPLLPRR